MSMTISINPSYFCNFSCDFCYLTTQQLRDKTKIELSKLDQLLKEVVTYDSIEWIDLYGGEVAVLPDDYLDLMKEVIRKYYTGPINIVTNFSTMNDRLFADDVVLSVSYDFEARQQSDRVFQNLMMSPKSVAVLILASKQVIDMDVDYMINMLNMCSSVESVEIKPYSINQANCYSVGHKDFEHFVERWLDSPVNKRFEFVNQSKIESCLDRSYNAYSDDHIYITPNGKFAVLEFDLNDKEYFLELDSFEGYIKWTQKEKAELSPICKACPYNGHCLTEHYRYVKDLEDSCNGYRFLLERYGRVES
jgi:sulfatase maturation enzyme AslB (radical SAM superfamily)